jgi:predicted SnoaL-like aldol condensation-catalyzing enzyme
MANRAAIRADKQFVQQFIDQVFNEHNAEATPDYLRPEAKWHAGTLGTVEGSDAMTDFYSALFTALPDLHATTLDIVADEDMVWFRFVVEGTSVGSLFGFPATGKRSGGTRSTATA